MRTVSNYLFELYRDYIPQLAGVAGATVDFSIDEPPTFNYANGEVTAVGMSQELVISAELYSERVWEGFVARRVGSLEFIAWRKVKYPIYPAKLEVSIKAWPGKETQDILEILKENFK